MKSITKKMLPTLLHEQNFNNLNVLTGLGIQLPGDQVKLHDLEKCLQDIGLKC